MPYSDEDDYAAFCRAMGEPEKATAAKAAKQPDKPASFNAFTQKATAAASDSGQVKASTAAWAGGLMRSCASAKVRDLRNKDIVSYHVSHESPDRLHIGRVVDADKGSATVEIQEHVVSDKGEYVPVNTRHTVSWTDVQNKFNEWPEQRTDEDDEDAEGVYDEAKARASFRAYFTSPSPKRKRGA
jgi:hypothetical protein